MLKKNKFPKKLALDLRKVLKKSNSLLLEQKLKLAIPLWQFALKNNWSRSEGWENTRFKGKLEREVFYFAASYYKRGVRAAENKSQQNFTQAIYDYKNLKEAFKNKNLRSSQNFYLIDKNLSSTFFFLKENSLKIKVSEATKNIETLQNILKEKNVLKSKTLVVIGGGCLLDLGGFLASLLQKKLIYMPSTLLAMVDASIGGKTAVNFFPYGKNLIGSFYPAYQIILVPTLLKTLKEKQIKEGLVEHVKHLMLQTKTPKKKILSLIKQSMEIKKSFIKKDLFEKNGQREFLNFGHTLAHGLEALGDQKKIHISHGEAVYLGMQFDCFLEEKLCQNKLATKRYEDLCRFYQLYFADLKKRQRKLLSKKNVSKLVTLMMQDKKNKGQKIKFVTPHSKIEVTKEEAAELLKSWTSF